MRRILPRMAPMAVPMAALVAALVATSACGPTHITPYKPRARTYEMPVKLDESVRAAQPGSLWTPTSKVRDLFRDQRALRLGDQLVVRVDERALARRDSSSLTEREAEISAKLEAFLGLVGGKAIGGGLSSRTRGADQIRKTEHLEATIPATVMKVLSSGNLFIEGRRVVLVNTQEYHFYISGVVRPTDVGPDNSVSSSVVADAEVEFSGRGGDLVKPY